MARYIDADKAVKDICNSALFKLKQAYRENNIAEARGLNQAKDILENQPTSDVKEVVRGENISELNPVDGFECSKCGIMLEGWTRVEIDEHDMDKSHCEYYFDFCPNCGADMREVKQYDK